ncbi:MAG: ribonuclease Z [Muribaculaceae bacterium]|nr:ribonuclease Z [Muribaculaceae bacterium]
MAKFQLNILGCGSATPTARHNPSCQVLDFRDNLLMIDCGEGAQKAMRLMGLKFARLNHIFISHLHGDHFFGLPGLIGTLSLHQRTGTLTIHMQQKGIDVMRPFIEAFAAPTTFDIVWNPTPETGGMLLDTHALSVEAFPLHHRVPCTGFIFREKPKPRHLKGDMVRYLDIPVSAMPAIKAGADWTSPTGEVIPNERLTSPAEPSVSYAYCSDTMFDVRVAEAVKGVDVLYHEATYASDKAATAAERGHSTAAEAGRIARMAGVKKLIIGHYSKRYMDLTVLLNEARAEFEATIAANEGLKIDLL